MGGKAQRIRSIIGRYKIDGKVKNSTGNEEMNNVTVGKYEVWILYYLNIRYARSGFLLLILN